MRINTFIPLPGPALPIPFNPGNGNGGIVPPWLQRDLGYEATNPTVKGHEDWRLDLRE